MGEGRGERGLPAGGIEKYGRGRRKSDFSITINLVRRSTAGLIVISERRLSQETNG